MKEAQVYPILPIRNTVTFPGTTIPLVVGRAKSSAALKYADQKDKLILVVAQKNIEEADPSAEDLYATATLCKLEGINGNEEKGFQVLLTGLHRFKITKFHTDGDFITAEGETLSDQFKSDSIRRSALFNSLKDLAKEIIVLLPGVDEAIMRLVDKLEDPSLLAYLCATYLNLNTEQKQDVLELNFVEDRMEKIIGVMQKEKEILEVQKDIRDKMSSKLGKAHRDSILREQLKAIQDELGDSEQAVSDELKEKLEKAGLPEEAQKIADKELERLQNLPAASAEYHVIRNYLEWLSEMPWNKASNSKIDLKKAKAILDEDHFGLDKVKKRILQYLAVAKLKNNLRGPILCLAGPPGVGKTSLGQSIAKALGREFIRTSLGGVRDEAEIRGHRRTYVGAMPGRIAQSLKRAGVNNPVMMLDEIDKLGTGFQGDPASAMLELLDPEQNKSFTDHYLDVPFDLSNVFFIATANMVDMIPPALRDRLEIIYLSSYTVNEKLHIAKNYLVPKQLEEHGLDNSKATISDDALQTIIEHYTREAGVRELQRNIASVFRSAAEDVVLEKPLPINIGSEDIKNISGLPRFYPEMADQDSRPGVVTGMAWTPFGGDILSIEASVMPGNGHLKLTGQLGDVMKESAQIALSYVRSELESQLKHITFDKTDIHIHVPSGAIPKDGPSAGVTLLTALTSLLLNRKVKPNIAMTGEITLRGQVLPVGGIKEKVIAAHRAGIDEVFLPMRNEADFSEVPEEIKSKLKVHFVNNVGEILEQVLGLEGLAEAQHKKYAS